MSRRVMDGSLLVLNQYYAPDVASTGQIAAELCEALAERGLEVHVVTAQPSYTAASSAAPPFEAENGVHVYRMPLWGPKGRERMVVRLSGYLQFLGKGGWFADRLARKVRPGHVITFHNPPLVPLLGAWLARKYGARFVYVLFDIHPDVLLATGWNLPSLVVRGWERVNRWIFQQADAVVVLGEGMRQTLLAKGVPPSKVNVIPLWGRPELSPMSADMALRRELDIGDEERVLLYAGNMGVMHPLEPLIDAARAVQKLPVRFVFVGDGVRRRELVSRVQKENLRNVVFLPFQPEERFVRLLSIADACFVVLGAGLETLALPSRTFTFMSAGKPIIAYMSPQGEVAKITREFDCGWHVASAEELIEVVRQIVAHPEVASRKGHTARQVYEERFSRKRVMEAYVHLLSHINAAPD